MVRWIDAVGTIVETAGVIEPDEGGVAVAQAAIGSAGAGELLARQETKKPIKSTIMAPRIK